MTGILIKENFISCDDVNHIIDFLDNHKCAVYSPQENSTLKYGSKSLAEGLRKNEVVNNLLDKIYSIIKDDENNYYHQYDMLLKSYPGTTLEEHYDLAQEDHTHPGVDQKSKRMVKTFVVYLNEDYKGGEFYIKDKLTYKPSKGSLVMFDGDIYLHGANMVKEKSRYILVSSYVSKNIRAPYKGG